MTAHHIGQRRPQRRHIHIPHNRNATGMLYTDDGPCNCSINHNRDCANDNGTTTGRCWTTNGAPPAAQHEHYPPGQPATVGASKIARTRNSTSSGVDCRDHHRRQRIPTEVEERIIHPTRSSPGTCANPGQNLLDGGGRRPVPAGAGELREPATPRYPPAVHRQRQSSSTTTAAGTMNPGRRCLPTANSPGSTDRMDFRDITRQTFIARLILTGDHRVAAATILHSARTALTSPTQCDTRILTCSSARPIITQLTGRGSSAPHPVRYIRAPTPGERTRYKPRPSHNPPGRHTPPHTSTSYIQLTITLGPLPAATSHRGRRTPNEPAAP